MNEKGWPEDGVLYDVNLSHNFSNLVLYHLSKISRTTPALLSSPDFAFVLTNQHVVSFELQASSDWKLGAAFAQLIFDKWY